MSNEDLAHLIGDDWETMDGRPARVVAIRKGRTDYPVVILAGKYDDMLALTADLKHAGKAETPFIRRKPKREKREVWLNIYPHSVGVRTFLSKKDADMDPYNSHRIACVRVEMEFEHGEGL